MINQSIKQWMQKLPLPITGLMLALAALGNLLFSYGSLYKTVLGILSATVMLLFILKVVLFPQAIKEGLKDPVIASVLPTFSMGLLLLSGYLQPLLPKCAYFLWFVGLFLHMGLIFLFTKNHIIHFTMKKVYPSYFVVYVGCICASITAPLFNLVYLGQLIFWFGFISYLILLPIVLYRTWIVKQIPTPALPTLAIYTAPANLCLAGYLSVFSNKNIVMIGFLAVLSLCMLVFVCLSMPKMLRLPFYPSFSAFTFPFVITAIAMKGTYAYLTTIQINIPFMGYFVHLLEIWAVLIVCYVLFKYTLFMFSDRSVTHAASQTDRNYNAP